MGSWASPEIVDIAFHELESRIIEIYTNKISLWTRFRDDVFMIFCGTQVELNNLSEKINQIHPTFKFSLESSDTEVTYHNPQMSTAPITQSIGYQNSFQYLHR